MTKSNEEAAAGVLAAYISTDFTDWPDRDLVDAYRRHSEVLMHYGFDLELAHRMGQIEEHSGTVLSIRSGLFRSFGTAVEESDPRAN